VARAKPLDELLGPAGDRLRGQIPEIRLPKLDLGVHMTDADLRAFETS
jgi:hypothetical protein